MLIKLNINIMCGVFGFKSSIHSKSLNSDIIIIFLNFHIP